MKKSTKAALVSALVFPGLGHMYLKKYFNGLILFGISFASIFYMSAKIVQSSRQIIEKIQSGAAQPDIASIMELVARQQNQADGSHIFDIATAIFLLCWLVGIIDSYRVGYGQDPKDTVLTKNHVGK